MGRSATYQAIGTPRRALKSSLLWSTASYRFVIERQARSWTSVASRPVMSPVSARWMRWLRPVSSEKAGPGAKKKPVCRSVDLRIERMAASENAAEKNCAGEREMKRSARKKMPGLRMTVWRARKNNRFKKFGCVVEKLESTGAKGIYLDKKVVAEKKQVSAEHGKSSPIDKNLNREQ